MKAIVCERYGSPGSLTVQEVDRPVASEGRVLVRVRASSVNLADLYDIRGPILVRTSGGLLRPKNPVQGRDVSGVVEDVGAGVTRFKPGDEVFGTGPGTMAEYVSAREDRLSLKPVRATHEQSACVPVAGTTALQGLRDKGQLRQGQKVIVNGSSGGVGTFAVQIAKALGATVTGVCSTGNTEQTSSLGADRVIDYTRDDFVRDAERYDVMFDVAGSRSLPDCRRVLVPKGIHVLAGMNPKRGMAGIIGRILRARLSSPFVSQRSVFYIAQINPSDLDALRGFVDDGKVTPVVDRTYNIDRAVDAFQYLAEGHARGKVAITV